MQASQVHDDAYPASNLRIVRARSSWTYAIAPGMIGS